MEVFDRIADRHESLLIRSIACWVKPKCYIETMPDRDGIVQSGEVKKVIRDKYHIPVCLKIKSGDGRTDYVPIDRITFFEPYDHDYDYHLDNYRTDDEIEDEFEAYGYEYNVEKERWENPKTGEVIG